ncbi:MAG: YqaA family protein [Cyanobacteriota bacterium]
MESLHHFLQQASQFFEQLGPLGLFLLAFIESSVFIIPPDTLLILLVLASPSSALFLALVCTIGSTLGGIFGYGLGYYGGRPVLNLVVKEEKIKKVNDLYDKYGVWAVAVAGFSPIPYKVFTISSGLFRLNLLAFTIASFLSRGARFFMVAIFLMIFGESFKENMSTYIIVGSIVLIVGIIAYLIYQNHTSKKQKQMDRGQEE